jgi:hypothetical protein
MTPRNRPDVPDGGTARGLLDEVARRLDASGLPTAVRTLVTGALATDRDTAAAPGTAARRAIALKSVTVRGFRGIGPSRTLELPPGPGLTVVTGRNGSGKSSFAEGIEVALTGENRRWADEDGRAAHPVQQRGWRNLHRPEDPLIELEVLLAGQDAPVTLTRSWPGGTFDGSRATVTGLDAEPVAVSRLGWADALRTFRPLLSYSELGRLMTARPTRMYDALAVVLGLGPLTEAQRRLTAREKALAEPAKHAEDAAAGLRAALAETDDDRARSAAKALARPADPETVRALLAGTPPVDAGELAALRRLAELEGPGPERVGDAVRRLRDAAADAADARHSSAGEARARAELLDQALRHHRRHGSDRACPVCGETLLDAEWAARASAQADLLRVEAATAEAAERRLRLARDAVLALVTDPPDCLPEAMRPLWAAWTGCRGLSDPEQLAASADKAATHLADACRQVRSEAREALGERDERWARLIPGLAVWLADTDAAAAARPLLAEVRKAREWLRKVQAELRRERMNGIRETATRIWQDLCEGSSVSLGDIDLKGAENYTGRTLELDVAVDDVEAPALSVVSQGELFSLALALFLPRATASDSPFGFVVIDDPVQSMDPRKVEGLARVLARVAETRQVVVFSHDTRLPDALRYHRLPATVLDVTRQDRSLVSVRRADDPVSAALAEARQAAHDLAREPTLLAEVLPGLCRIALEAALHEAAMRKVFDPGSSPAEALAAAEEVDGAGKLTRLASLVLFGASRPDRQVYAELRRRLGREAEQIVSWCNQGSHRVVDVTGPPARVEAVKRVAQGMRRL